MRNFFKDLFAFRCGPTKTSWNAKYHWYQDCQSVGRSIVFDELNVIVETSEGTVTLPVDANRLRETDPVFYRSIIAYIKHGEQHDSLERKIAVGQTVA